MTEKIPRGYTEALPVAFELLNLLKPAARVIELAGSLRRRVMTVSDIEIVAIPKIEEISESQPDLFSEPSVKSYNLLLSALDGFLEKLGLPYEKKGERYRRFPFRLKAGGHIPVDLFLARPETFGWIWLIRTGSAEFSRAVAIRLNRVGYTSQEGQIIRADDKTPVETRSEKDVFDLIGCQLVPPDLRTGDDVLERFTRPN